MIHIVWGQLKVLRMFSLEKNQDLMNGVMRGVSKGLKGWHRQEGQTWSGCARRVEVTGRHDLRKIHKPPSALVSPPVKWRAWTKWTLSIILSHLLITDLLQQIILCKPRSFWSFCGLPVPWRTLLSLDLAVLWFLHSAIKWQSCFSSPHTLPS